MKYLVCNLKSNQTLIEAIKYSKELANIDTSKVNLVICPSYPYLPFFNSDQYFLGAQNVSKFAEGAFTGEVNIKQLVSLKTKFVLVGHSERRHLYEETEDDFIKKIKKNIEHEVVSIYCVGETKEQYDSKRTFNVLERQIARILNNFDADEIRNIIIAYEPIWAIGSGSTPSISELEEVTLFIKKLLNNYYGTKPIVLYGGSVNEDNIKEINKIESIEGLLVGGASLDIEKVKKLIEALE